MVWGCGGAPGNYERPRVSVPADRMTVLDAVVDQVSALGWRVTAVDARAGVVEAETPIELMAGVATRQHWTFVLTPGELAAELEFEVQWDPAVDRWESRREVCDGYSYLRERLQLEAIAERVRALALHLSGRPSS
jgi:hypothetical protein